MRDLSTLCVKCFRYHVKHDLFMLVSGFSSGVAVIVSALWSFIDYVCFRDSCNILGSFSLWLVT